MEKFDNTGLPNSNIYSHFSFTILNWIQKNHFKIELDHYPEHSTELSDLLYQTLPPHEKEQCTLGLNNKLLLRQLHIKDSCLLNFIVNQTKILDYSPSIQDYFFDRLNLVFKLKLSSNSVTKLNNYIPSGSPYIQQDWSKDFNTKQWLLKKLPAGTKNDTTNRGKIISTIKNSLILLQRETDPVTYLDQESLRYYNLERGIGIALYTMTTDRQIYPEIYIGYTLFKNGIPAAYGGAWIFGQTALIGLNIFNWCRGGESNFLFVQVLRLYHHIFGISQFEVEPFQFGKDNPEGIKSAAFWFYYRIGFRPAKKSIHQLATQEYQKRQRNAMYKTPTSLLYKFTECNLRLRINNDNLMLKTTTVRNRILQMITMKYHGDRYQATQDCLRWLCAELGNNSILANLYPKVPEEMALMNRAFDFPISKEKSLIKSLLLTKNSNQYEYHESLLKWMKKIKLVYNLV
ncbi:MAG: hypothetical protein IPM48_13215 [Saprospiraceae bacterium]|nr:hypothetical protein [Saprospiraceae bacterium]